MQKRIFLLISILFLLIPIKVNAAPFNITDNKKVNVLSDHIHVYESKTINISGADWFLPDKENISFLIYNSKDLSDTLNIKRTEDSIKVTDKSGKVLNYTTSIDDNNNILIQAFIPKQLNTGENYTINLEYDSYLLSSIKNNGQTIVIPKLDQKDLFSNEIYNTNLTYNITIPKSLGGVSSDKDINLTSDNDNWNLNITKDQLSTSSILISIDSNKIYKFTIAFSTAKTSELLLPLNIYHIVLPKDLSNSYLTQSVYFDHLNPTPLYINLDSNNDLIATFYLPSSKKIDINITGYILIKPNLNNDKSNASNSSLTPQFSYSKDSVYGNLYGEITVKLNSSIDIQNTDVSADQISKNSISMTSLLNNNKYQNIGHFITYLKISINNLTGELHLSNITAVAIVMILILVILVGGFLVLRISINKRKKIKKEETSL